MVSARAALGIVMGSLTLVVAAAAPADAQWSIYLQGKTEPIVAHEYVEDAPWIFYRDDQSMYVFALGCNRVDRVERGGAPLPRPACPVEALPTSMPRIYLAIMDLEAKRLDDNIAKLQAVIGTFAASGELFGVARTRAEQELQRRRALDAVAFLQSQINDTLLDIRLSESRVGSLLDASKSYPRGERQRFFFFAR